MADLENATRRSRRRLRGSSGQAIVEFGLVAVPFFLVFFSIVEFALITASIGSFDFAARDAARIGAIVGPTDPCIDTDPGTVAVTCGGIGPIGPTGISGILTTIKGHVQGLVMANATEIDIYDADSASGECISSAGPVQVDAPGCMEDEYLIGANWTWTEPVSTYPATSRNDSITKDDYLGVRVLYQYTYVTSFVAGLGTNLSLSATSVQEIEPQTTILQHHSSRTTLARALDAPQVLTMAALLPAGSPDSPVHLGRAPSDWWLRKGLGGRA